MRLPSLYNHYKEHFACFRCRRMIRRLAWVDLSEQEQARYGTEHQYLASSACPECGDPVRNMGKGFRPPKRSDVKAWQELEQSRGSFDGWHNRW